MSEPVDEAALSAAFNELRDLAKKYERDGVTFLCYMTTPTKARAAFYGPPIDAFGLAGVALSDTKEKYEEWRQWEKE